MLRIRNVFLDGNFASGYYFTATDEIGDLWHSKKRGNYSTMRNFLKILKKKGEINPDRWVRVSRFGVPTTSVTGTRTNWTGDQSEPKKFGSQRNTGLSWSARGSALNTNITDEKKVKEY